MHQCDYFVINHQLTPVEAEIRIFLGIRGEGEDVKVRGRLTGPRCPYTSTVEVAYPMQQLPPSHYTWSVAYPLIVRAIIPEPSLWDPVSPFLYQGSLLVLQKDQPWIEVRLSHGLREFRLSRNGLRWNSQPLTLRGIACERLTEEEALRLHREGYNALLVPVAEETAAVWEIADRYGFVVIGRWPGTQESLALIHRLKQHPSCLAWLVSEEMARKELFYSLGLPQLSSENYPLVGLEYERGIPEPLPKDIRFFVCQENALPQLEAIPRPKLVLGKPRAEGETPTAILGWIETE
jgi:hypothetical protein